jgi:hypothetical protein
MPPSASATVCAAPRPQLFGLQAIAAFVGLDLAETERRVESGEIPTERTSKMRMPIADKAELARLRASAHFRRC